MNGGRHASRGLYLQALISVLESVRITAWKNILVEPDEEKVDIEITFIDNSIKVIQVKSTKNDFKPSNIDKVINSLVNANTNAKEYEVVFIGNFSPTAQKAYLESDLDNITTENTNIKITQIEFNLELINNLVKQELNKYLGELGLEVNKDKLNLINGNLISDTLLASTEGKILLKEQFNDRLRGFVEILNEQDEKQTNKIKISSEAIKLAKKWRIIKFTGLLLTIIFLISPIIKYSFEGLDIIDLLGVLVFWISIISVFSFFKISDVKYKQIESEEYRDYSKNNNKAENSILKIEVRDKIEFLNGNKKVFRQIVLHNLGDKKIDFIQFDIFFYYSNKRMYKQEFAFDNIRPFESITVYENYLVKQKSKKYWTKFILKVTNTSTEELIDNELYSSSIVRSDYTLLNSYYLPVIKELFFYESTWAIEKLNDYFRKIKFYCKERTLKRISLVILNILIINFITIFLMVGIYNSLYLVIKLLTHMYLLNN
ncbi:hypothetical protein [Lysinibacillus sp. RC79]|uniref:hypothetical protein n=1 Tax=Lysinibacillus sp. RC79 TaxID=3156296 RepID=UPI0035124A10